MTGYLPVAIYLGFIVAFAVVSLGAAAVLRPSRPYASKLENYECGAEPIGEAWVQFPVGFYLVALIFIVFDALAVFLFPWALTLRSVGLWAVGTMGLFLTLLLLFIRFLPALNMFEMRILTPEAAKAHGEEK